jgi:hypothetical protein
MLIVSSADEDVAVRVAGVEMVDRDPIEPGAEVLFDLPHHVSGKRPRVREPVNVRRSNDEPELMVVLPSALGEPLAVRPCISAP